MPAAVLRHLLPALAESLEPVQLGGALCLACVVTSAGELPAHLVARACQAPHRPLAWTPALPLIRRRTGR